LAVAQDTSVSIEDIVTHENPVTLVPKETELRVAVFSPDAKHLATANGKGTVVVWDIDSGRQLRSLSSSGVHTVAHTIAWSASGKQLATTSYRDRPRLWDAETGSLLRTPVVQSGTSTGVAFSPDGKFVATANHNGALRVWEVATGREVQSSIDVIPNGVL